MRAGSLEAAREVMAAGPAVAGGLQVAKGEVLERWRSTAFLADASLNARGWLLAVMRAVEAIGRPEFTLDEVYAHEEALAALYPGNNNVRPKSGSSCRCCGIRGGWSSMGGGRIASPAAKFYRA